MHLRLLVFGVFSLGGLGRPSASKRSVGRRHVRDNFRVHLSIVLCGVVEYVHFPLLVKRLHYRPLTSVFLKRAIAARNPFRARFEENFGPCRPICRHVGSQLVRGNALCRRRQQDLAKTPLRGVDARGQVGGNVSLDYVE